MSAARTPLVFVLLVAGPLAALPRWWGPSAWPVERLAQNVGAYVREHPEDPAGHFCLGRIHGLAFRLGTTELVTFDREIDDESLPTLAEDPLQEGRAQRAQVSQGEGLRHLEQAVRHLAEAARLARDQAAYWLGLAYVLEQGAPLASQLAAPDVHGITDDTPDPARASRIAELVQRLGADGESGQEALRTLCEPAWLAPSLPALLAERETPDALRRRRVAELLEHAWLERALEAYGRAFSLARPADEAEDTQPCGNVGPEPLRALVSYEAGQGFRRLLARRAATAEEQERLRQVETTLETLAAKPPCNWITPILLTLEGCPAVEGLEDRIEPDANVLFDLDGDGLEEGWPWLRPEAGWLVWDPERTGRVTSGQQLFGSASGWLFFPDGYRVLDALDDDRDGRLAGAELAGIAVWFDRDADGVSDPGEVLPVEALGIVALATAATTTVDASPASPCGVELADGRVLPTWDWVLRPAAHPAP